MSNVDTVNVVCIDVAWKYNKCFETQAASTEPLFTKFQMFALNKIIYKIIFLKIESDSNRQEKCVRNLQNNFLPVAVPGKRPPTWSR